MVTQIKTQSLYDQDFYLWLETTVKHLKEKNLDELDWNNLIEEIEALGKEQKRAVFSYLKQLLKHLLMYSYWEAEKIYCANGWRAEIDEFRDQLNFLLESQTLYDYAESSLESAYLKAKKQFLDKTGLPKNIAPEQCSFTLIQVLDFDYLPE